jgi:hypothetical protein
MPDCFRVKRKPENGKKRAKTLGESKLGGDKAGTKGE